MKRYRRVHKLARRLRVEVLQRNRFYYAELQDLLAGLNRVDPNDPWLHVIINRRSKRWRFMSAKDGRA